MLELKNLSYEAEEEGKIKLILNNINMKIEKESLIVITGPNGSGKSTLAKIVMGILKPKSGKILLDGQDITDLGVTDRAKVGISFAFQQPVRFKGMTVRDLVSLAAGESLSKAEVCKYLSEVGLCAKDYVKRELNSTLSGGELKRIEIATVIARKGKFSIFDEPEAGIDLWSFHNLIRVFEKMRAETLGNIMVISHQERILEIADKIIVLKEGQISQEGNKEDILPGLLSSTDTCDFYRGGY